MAISKASVVILLGIIAAAQAGCTNSWGQRLIRRWVRFESYNYPEYFIRHRSSWVRIDKHQANKLFLKDSYWKVVKGLCGCGVSFQSYNYPDHYIRHRGYWARIDKFQNKALFKKDACFIAHRGLADRRKYSFESYNYRGYFLRHRNSWMRIDRNDRSALFKKDATFKPV